MYIALEIKFDIARKRLYWGDNISPFKHLYFQVVIGVIFITSFGKEIEPVGWSLALREL